MPPYNIVNDFYLRQAQPCFPPQSIPQINGRFVTNKEEARAALIDGFSYNIFLDTSNGKIYLKKLNNNGVADFIIYSIEDTKPADPISEMNQRLTKIENYLGGQNESISDNTGFHKSAAIFNQSTQRPNERNDEAEPPSLSESYGNDQW